MLLRVISKSSLYLTFVITLFSSCATRIDSIEDFHNQKLIYNIFTPNFSVLQNPKYRVFTDNLDIANILQKMQTVTLVERKDLAEFIINSKLEKKIFHNKTIILGYIEITNFENIREKYIPLFNIDLQNVKVKNELKSFFIYPRGFIVSKRVNRDNVLIFKINIGKNFNIKEGTRVYIYNQIVKDNFFDKNKYQSLQKIGVGVVSRFIEKDYSWIYLEDNRVGDNILFGSMVIVKDKNFKNYLEDGKLFIDRNLVEF